MCIRVEARAPNLVVMFSLDIMNLPSVPNKSVSAIVMDRMLLARLVLLSLTCKEHCAGGSYLMGLQRFWEKDLHFDWKVLEVLLRHCCNSLFARSCSTMHALASSICTS